MKTKPLKFVLIVILFIFCACSNGDKNGTSFTLESFGSQHTLSGRIEYKNDSLFLGNPKSLRFHPGGLLIIEDVGTPKFITIIDLKTNRIQKIISQGKGPGEMIISWGPQILNDSLYAFCGELRKVLIFSPDNNRHFVLRDEFLIDEKGSDRFHPVSPKMHVCLSNLGEDKRLTFLDEKGKIVRKMGGFPHTLNENEITPDNEIFSSTITSSPEGTKIVLACTLDDILEIYDKDNGLVKRIQGPLGLKLTVIRENFGNGYMLRTMPRYLTYGNIIAGDNEFWVTYNGIKVQRGKPPSLQEQYTIQIFCFDWNGKPIRIIKPDCPVISFDVDWNRKILYAIKWEKDDYKIISYSLAKIL